MPHSQRGNSGEFEDMDVPDGDGQREGPSGADGTRGLTGQSRAGQPVSGREGGNSGTC